MMNWKKFGANRPDENKPVLICFEKGNPWSVTMGELVYLEDDNFPNGMMWFRGVDKSLPVDEGDYWAYLTEDMIPSAWM